MKIKEITIATLEEFDNFLKEINYRELFYLYRGMTDENYKPTSSMRYGWGDHLSIDEIIEKMEDETNKIINQYTQSPLPYMEKISNHQHNIRGTFLSDYTWNPFVSLHFACLTKNGKKGKIIVIPSYGDCIVHTTPEEIENLEFDHFVSNDPKISNDKSIRVWMGRRTNNKLLYQSSIFAIDQGDIEIRINKITKYLIYIPDNAKESISQELLDREKYLNMCNAPFDGKNIKNMFEESNCSDMLDLLAINSLVSNKFNSDEWNEFISLMHCLENKKFDHFDQLIERGVLSKHTKTLNEMIDVKNFLQKADLDKSLSPIGVLPDYLAISYLMDTSQHDLAVDYCENEKNKPIDAITFLTFARAFAEIHDYKNSIKNYKNFLCIFTKDQNIDGNKREFLLSQVNSKMAHIFHEMGWHNDAFNCLNNIDDEFHTVKSLNFKGEIHRRLYQHDDAIAAFTFAKHKLRDGHLSCHPFFNTAVCYVQKGNYDDAILECFRFISGRFEHHGTHRVLYECGKRIDLNGFGLLSEYCKEKMEYYNKDTAQNPSEKEYLNKSNTNCHVCSTKYEILASFSDFFAEHQLSIGKMTHLTHEVFDKTSCEYKKMMKSLSYFALGSLMLRDSITPTKRRENPFGPGTPTLTVESEIDVAKMQKAKPYLEKSMKIMPNNVCKNNLIYAKEILERQNDGVLNEPGIVYTTSRYGCDVTEYREKLKRQFSR